MRESRTYGSVRGALSNERPYRDLFAACRLWVMDSPKTASAFESDAPRTASGSWAAVRPRGAKRPQHLQHRKFGEPGGTHAACQTLTHAPQQTIFGLQELTRPPRAPRSNGG